MNRYTLILTFLLSLMMIQTSVGGELDGKGLICNLNQPFKRHDFWYFMDGKAFKLLTDRSSKQVLQVESKNPYRVFTNEVQWSLYMRDYNIDMVFTLNRKTLIVRVVFADVDLEMPCKVSDSLSQLGSLAKKQWRENLRGNKI